MFKTNDLIKVNGFAYWDARNHLNEFTYLYSYQGLHYVRNIKDKMKYGFYLKSLELIEKSSGHYNTNIFK